MKVSSLSLWWLTVDEYDHQIRSHLNRDREFLLLYANIPYSSRQRGIFTLLCLVSERERPCPVVFPDFLKHSFHTSPPSQKLNCQGHNWSLLLLGSRLAAFSNAVLVLWLPWRPIFCTRCDCEGMGDKWNCHPTAVTHQSVPRTTSVSSVPF